MILTIEHDVIRTGPGFESRALWFIGFSAMLLLIHPTGVSEIVAEHWPGTSGTESSCSRVNCMQYSVTGTKINRSVVSDRRG